MKLDELKDTLKNLLTIDMGRAFEELSKALSPDSPQQITFATLQGSYLSFYQKKIKGTITYEEITVTEAKLMEGYLKLIVLLTESDFKKKAPPTEATRTLHEYHAHTCDRVDQSDQFQKLFGGKRDQKVHFFYLYGMELQSHKGLFKRLAYGLEGRLEDYLNPDLKLVARSLQVEITFRPSNDMDVYKLNMLRSLLAALSISVNEQEPLLEKDLKWIREKSPMLKGLGSDDYACIFIGISERGWDKVLTPLAARWFIQQFCKGPFPDDFPTFLFFFAIIYEDDESPTEKEVEEIVSKSDLVMALPELNMVQKDEIKDWFTTYDFIAESAREMRELRNKHFSGEEEFYMDDVEFELEKIIKAYNAKYFK